MAHKTKLDLDPEFKKRTLQLAGMDDDVLITGPSGSGKSALAQWIHEQSARRGKRFVVQNCGAIPKGLEESTLFGHERGAFTHAHQAADGIVKAADGGTLFLDEIGELPLAVQVKLLTLLQEHAYRRVGSVDDLHASFRLIAATNRDLLELCNQGHFREDLYHRINVLPIALGPLRDAPERATRIATEIVKTSIMSPERAADVLSAVQRLSRHPAAWPGNIRELGTFVKRCQLDEVKDAERWILAEWARRRTSESAERLTAFTPSVSPSLADRKRYAGLIHELAGRGPRPKAAVSRKGSLELASRLLDVFPEPLSLDEVQAVLGARDRRTLDGNVDLLERHGLIERVARGIVALWPPATSAVFGRHQGAWRPAGSGEILSLACGDRVRIELTSKCAGTLGVLLVTHGPGGSPAPTVLVEGKELLASKPTALEIELDGAGGIEQFLLHVGPSARRGGSLVEPMLDEAIMPDSAALEWGRRMVLDRWGEGWLAEHLVFHMQGK
ncbi:sigma-54 factor interaction domain-containing protein [Sorangium sp. So ce291]|uniref:sigma 54-interacting transcriptional regulator n=1 Tax=Sorangium sp. So ce291 TaxID=3133294 RepID=UPI003F61D9ED